MATKTVYISIGNSDNKLDHYRWRRLYDTVDELIRLHAARIHGKWHSIPPSEYVNACWCIEAIDYVDTIERFKQRLREVAGAFDQDSISWAEAKTTLLKPEQGE